MTDTKFRRTRVDGDTTALALSFDADPMGPEHDTILVGWTADAAAVLKALDDNLRQKEPTRSLPVRSLRIRISISDPDLLRLEPRLGLRGDPTIAWTAARSDDASRRLRYAVLGWLANAFVRSDGPDVNERLAQLRSLSETDRLFTVERRRSRVFNWTQTRSGTARPGPDNREGYSDLADFAARQLEAAELFPGLGPMKRVVAKDLRSNRAELMTAPITERGARFSLVLRLTVLSYPGRGTPIVELGFSKRFWMRRVKNASARGVRAFAVPKDRNVALEFGLRRQRPVRGASFPYETGDDFSPIARHFGLPLNMSAQEIADRGYSLDECPLLIVNPPGVGERLDDKTGVPDRDKLEGFLRAADILKPFGLHPWRGLTAIDTPSRAIKDRNQGWRNDEKSAPWREQMQGHIDSCYGGCHHIVLGYHDSCYLDGKQAQEKLIDLLGDRIRVQPIPIQGDVHGPREALPSHASDRPEDRARVRSEGWQPFVEQVRRYTRDVRSPVDGVLIIAPEWYKLDGRPAHDDLVNKRAGRIAISRNLGVPVQYLLPVREGRLRDPELDFETRTVAAWLDLAWSSLGRVDPARLEKTVAYLYGTSSGINANPPDRILALSVLQKNSTRRRRNAGSFVPVAIELDMRTGTCSVRFASQKSGGGIEYSQQSMMPMAIAELAASGPITFGSDYERRGQRSQAFFYEAITEFCSRAADPLVIIDATTCRSVWPWLRDSDLDPSNVLLASHPHAESDWGNVRILRVRTQNAPKVLLDGNVVGKEIDGCRSIEYSAPKRADAQIYRVDDSRANVYLSFGSLLRTTLTQGLSCYRRVEILKRKRGIPRTYILDNRSPFTGAWSTPSAVEFTVVRTAPGEHPDQLAVLAEGLRSPVCSYRRLDDKARTTFL